MEDTYSLGLALLDFVPNLSFLVGGIFLVRMLRLAMDAGTTRMGIVGVTLVFSGGLLKAIWKLLYTLQIADLDLLNQAQFALLAPGFLALLVCAIRLARANRLPAAPGMMAMAVWKIPLLAIMTLSSIGMQGVLTYLSFQRGRRLAAAFYIVAVLCTFGMSAMAGGVEQTVANQWIEEVMNTIGQTAFAAGSVLLYQSYRGLELAGARPVSKPA